jgi:hypothetical protein
LLTTTSIRPSAAQARSTTPRIDTISDKSSPVCHSRSPPLRVQVVYDRKVAHGPGDAVAAREQLLGHDVAEAAAHAR